MQRMNIKYQDFKKNS